MKFCVRGTALTKQNESADNVVDIAIAWDATPGSLL